MLTGKLDAKKSMPIVQSIYTYQIYDNTEIPDLSDIEKHVLCVNQLVVAVSTICCPKT